MSHGIAVRTATAARALLRDDDSGARHTTRADRSRPRLRRDDRGAVMVIGVFMAVILVGMLYFLIGIGDAILVREKLQDAADATAFSSAIVLARGMNIIALLNITMAGLLAILVMLKMIVAATTAVIAVLVGISWLFPGALVAVPPLETMNRAADTAATAYERVVMKALWGINKLSTAAGKTVPVAAQAKAIEFGTKVYRPPAQMAFLFPVYSGLPIAEDKFEVLCRRAGTYAGAAIAFPIEKIGGAAGRRAGRLIEKFTGGLATKFAMYFCGGEAPPAITYERTTFLPELDTREARTCREKRDAAACDAAKRQVERLRRAYDYARGECSPGADRDACRDMLRRARTQCTPDAADVEQWWIREETFEREWKLVTDPRTRKQSVVLVDERRRQSPPRYRPSRLTDEGDDEPPCAGDEWSPWNTSPNEPVCVEQIDPPSVMEFQIRNTTTIVRTFREVTDVIGCLRVTQESQDLKAQRLSGSTRGRTPKQVCNCAELGEQRFQVKAFVIGEAQRLFSRDERGVRVANFGRNAGRPSSLVRYLQKVGRIAMAQAEYYYDGDPTKRGEWLWNMYWKARLRRFHLDPTGWECRYRGRDDNCPGLGVARLCGRACAAGRKVFAKLGGLVLH
ncbi:MAG: hypothetical protein D6689_22025 [Deltaproteobacteria bacterium]|nr:MAG: hypothetical protein D6689_22025 [Deltaproteobacteria bacterium]